MEQVNINGVAGILSNIVHIVGNTPEFTGKYLELLSHTEYLAGTLENTKIPITLSVPASTWNDSAKELKYRCIRANIHTGLFYDRVNQAYYEEFGSIIRCNFNTAKSHCGISKFYTQLNTYVAYTSDAEPYYRPYINEDIVVTHSGKPLIGRLDMMGNIPVSLTISNIHPSYIGLFRCYLMMKGYEFIPSDWFQTLPPGVSIQGGDESYFDYVQELDKYIEVLHVSTSPAC